MQTWIALLRGINVGGRNVLPMQVLRDILADLGLQRPRTYIQSGNCVFDWDGRDPAVLAAQITKRIEATAGFAPRTLVMPQQTLQDALAANPFADHVADPKHLHLFFLAAPATAPDLAAMEAIKRPSEAYALTETTLFLHTPDGFHSSKLADKVERLLGTPATARNLRSAQKIADLART
jgi:uncharacterized protein (DUF1697 family)